jgi:hypothetical protein
LDARWNPIGRAAQSVGTWNTDWIEELKKLPEAIVTHEIEPMGEVVRLTNRIPGLYGGRDGAAARSFSAG